MRSSFLFLLALALHAAEHRGQVLFNGLPVPGATVVASRSKSKVAAVTGAEGAYSFPDLAEGAWTMTVEISGFSRIEREVTVGASATEPEKWELKILGLEELRAQIQKPALTPREPVAPAPPKPDAPKPAASEAFANLSPEELQRRAADGLLVNGSTLNGAASPFGQAFAFGNNRRGGRSLYNGNLGLILGNSAFDARPFSLTGQNTPRPDYNRIQGLASFAGPLRFGRYLRNGPQLVLNYQWLRNRNVTNHTALMPTTGARAGDFSPLATVIYDPETGLPFPDNVIPSSRISPQARRLLEMYPLPNFTNNARYNFQVPLIGNTHQDNLQSRFNQQLPRRNRLYGTVGYQGTRGDTTNVFGFLNATRTTGLNTEINWLHMLQPRVYMVLGLQFSRLSSTTVPFFANRTNVSGEAGIMGNNQEPVNWGPPALTFASGIAALGDVQASATHYQTSGVTADFGWNRGRHALSAGAGFRKQQFNVVAQEDARGSFAFTGASTQGAASGSPIQGTGLDFAGFLLGIPDTSSIAFGNADKYLRASLANAYITDDWRINPGLTVNLGIRWEYWSPINERYGRLVNLDGASGFTAVTPVVGDGLLRPDRNNLAPRIGFAWRPMAASSMLIRGGYGIYHDTSVYQPIAMQMAQQSPLSTSLRVQNSPDTPLTLANGFVAPPSVLRNTFAVDPNFRIGYSQNWQVSLQRDLPASLVVIATYLGVKGTRAQQQILPNTFPIGAVDPCPDCPTGFAYLATNGNSTRQAGTIELRRRLRAGFTAAVTYTYSKSIDNAALGGRNQGGALIAQNWLDLAAERARSNFDQRHLVSFQTQYTTGMGMRGVLLGGWRGRLLKEWTIATQITAGTGLPLNPVYPFAVTGTGVTSSLRPDYTGAPLYTAPPGFFLNPAAVAPPASSQWGNAGRNSITGPRQFTMDASMARTFRLNDRFNLETRLDATNALNHPVFPSWNSTVTSAQFGLPNPANPMRAAQITTRLRF
jgi:hypothetical protein